MTGRDTVVRLCTERWCPHCRAARRLFRRLGVGFDEVQLDHDPVLRRQLSNRCGGWATVPMILVGDRCIGGFTDALALHRRDELLPMVRRAGDTGG